MDQLHEGYPARLRRAGEVLSAAEPLTRPKFCRAVRGEAALSRVGGTFCLLAALLFPACLFGISSNRYPFCPNAECYRPLSSPVARLECQRAGPSFTRHTHDFRAIRNKNGPHGPMRTPVPSF